MKEPNLERDFVKEFGTLVTNHIAEEYLSLSIRVIKSKCPTDYGKVEKNIK